MTTSDEVYVLDYAKDGQRYIFLFDEANRVETLRQAGRFAANPELSFNWHDAAIISQHVRSADESWDSPGVATVTPRGRRW